MAACGPGILVQTDGTDQFYQGVLAQNQIATGKSFKHSHNRKLIVWQSQSEHLECTDRF